MLSLKHCMVASDTKYLQTGFIAFTETVNTGRQCNKYNASIQISLPNTHKSDSSGGGKSLRLLVLPIVPWGLEVAKGAGLSGDL